MNRSKMTDRQKFQEARWEQGEPQREAERQRLLTTETPNRKRITIALDTRSLYGPEVDIACGGVEPMVDEWEAGTRVPTPEQMIKLAELTQYPVEYFYGEDPPEITNVFICGRGRRTTPKAPKVDIDDPADELRRRREPLVPPVIEEHEPRDEVVAQRIAEARESLKKPTKESK